MQKKFTIMYACTSAGYDCNPNIYQIEDELWRYSLKRDYKDLVMTSDEEFQRKSLSLRGIQKLIERVKKGNVCKVITFGPAMLAEDVGDFLVLQKLFLDYQIKVEYIKPQYPKSALESYAQLELASTPPSRTTERKPNWVKVGQNKKAESLGSEMAFLEKTIKL
jgi:hypothetical protein